MRRVRGKIHRVLFREEGEAMVDQQDPRPFWRKSAQCSSAACVEVAKRGDSYLVRDSKNPDGPTLAFTPAEWEAFAAGMVAGDFRFD